MPKHRSKSQLGWLALRQDTLANAHWLRGLVSNALLVAVAALPFLVVYTLFLLIKAMISPDDGTDVRNIGLFLAGLIGLPFIAWRTMVAAKQVDIAEESLFNDKINAAATDLAARRQVTTVLGEGDKRTVITEWKDDLVTRAAAIDRLEGLANERPDTAPRIASMLSIYVRALSAEYPALDHPRVEYLRRTEHEGESSSQVMKDLGMKLDDETVMSQTYWARALKPIRSDMEKAAQTLGRLKTIEGVDPDVIQIDLRRANLQGFDLTALSFPNSQFEGARMEGTNLIWVQMDEANFYKARMEGANLTAARMDGANLIRARMEGADLRKARMERANLIGAHFSESTDFRAAVAQYAAVELTPLFGKGVDQDLVNSLFGDGSVTLPDGITRPAHWPEENLGWSEFEVKWRAWQRAQGYEPPE